MRSSVETVRFVPPPTATLGIGVPLNDWGWDELDAENSPLHQELFAVPA